MASVATASTGSLYDELGRRYLDRADELMRLLDPELVGLDEQDRASIRVLAAAVCAGCFLPGELADLSERGTEAELTEEAALRLRMMSDGQRAERLEAWRG